MRKVIDLECDPPPDEHGNHASSRRHACSRTMGDAFPAHNGYGRNQIAEVAFQSTVAA